MTYIESFIPPRIENSELLKAAENLLGDDNLLQDLDEPIALQCTTEPVTAPDTIKRTDASDSQTIKIICRNESLAGEKHPVTGVLFELKTIEVEGQFYEVAVPQFESDFNTTLPEEMHTSSDREQFSKCNEELKNAIQSNPDLRNIFTQEQIEQIENGDRPDGYVWHHAENPGEMQLIKREVHDQTGHTGGKSFWGGGSENR